MLTIQFGQCGNQLGHELFSKISKDIESRNSGLSFEGNYDYSEASCEKWFSGITKDGRRTARAILIDTERKVIDKIRGRDASNARWHYSPKNLIYQATGGGSGNNWAYGYCVKSRELEDEIVEAVRLETERADRLDGFFGILGCAGGTGSGVGSKTLQILREEYPTKTLLANLVLPFVGGEVGTQNYNSLLTLAKLSDVIDAMILMENDQLLRICKSVGGQRSNDPIFMRDMNEVACEKIVSVFQPVNSKQRIRNEANHFAKEMAPHSGYKITTIKCTTPLKLSRGADAEPGTIFKSTETSSLKWLFHVRQLKHTLRISGGPSNYEVTTNVAENKSKGTSDRDGKADSTRYSYRRSIANILITRGYSSNHNTPRNSLQRTDNDEFNWELFSDDVLYPNWIPRDHRFNHLHQKRRLLEREKFATLVTNNSQICEPLDGLVNSAWNCYTNAAFLHRYKAFGLEDDDFLRAFAKVENIIKMYGELDEKS